MSHADAVELLLMLVDICAGHIVITITSYGFKNRQTEHIFIFFVSAYRLILERINNY